jgi:hypothetical protein
MLQVLLIVALTDVILFSLIRLVRTHFMQQGQNVPVPHLVGLSVFCVLAHFGATQMAGRAVADTDNMRFVALISALFGAVPIAAYVHMLFTRIAEETENRTTALYPRARALRLDGDIDGALEEYMAYFDNNPSVPRPLFSAAGMLEQEKQFEKAAEVFRRITIYFAEDDVVWTRAAFRLLFLHDHHLDDPKGAAFIRNQIEQRVPPDQRAKYESRDLESSNF